MISRRSFIATAAAVAVPQQQRPNFVLIVADDLGYGDLSSYGCPDIRTPAIDSIGKQGVRFTQYYSNAPECTPSRAALLTGRYQHRVGGLECAIGVGNVGRYDEAEWLAKRGELGLPATETSLAQVLKRRGYDTACFGKWHLGYEDKFSPNRHGFDEYLGVLGGNADYFHHTEPDGTHMLRHNGKPVRRDGEYFTEIIGKEAVRWLRARSSRPFFLYLPFTAPHDPYQGPGDANTPRDKAPRRDRQVFAAMTEAMDQQVAAVLETLERMKLADNTFVMFISDNGGTATGRNAPFRGTKTTCWEGGIRVPCMMRWPAFLPKGVETKQVAMGMDLMPTMLGAFDPPVIYRPSLRLDGINLLPLLAGVRPPQPRTLFWRYRRMQNVRKAVLDGSMKYVIDNGSEELHDIAADPKEANNLLAARPDTANALKAKLAAWEREVAAPRMRDFMKRGQPDLSDLNRSDQAVPF